MPYKSIVLLSVMTGNTDGIIIFAHIDNASVTPFFTSAEKIKVKAYKTGSRKDIVVFTEIFFGFKCFILYDISVKVIICRFQS